MPIAAEHLLDDATDVGWEAWGKAGGFANPIAELAGELRKWGRERSRWGGDRSSSGVAGLRGDVTRGKGSRINRCGRVGRESERIMNLADNPFLNTVDIRWSRDFRRPTIFEPGVGKSSCCQNTERP